MASLNGVSQLDEIVDVLICGYGCAGASAAIEVRDTAPDARALIVEGAEAIRRRQLPSFRSVAADL